MASRFSSHERNLCRTYLQISKSETSKMIRWFVLPHGRTPRPLELYRLMASQKPSAMGLKNPIIFCYCRIFGGLGVDTETVVDCDIL